MSIEEPQTESNFVPVNIGDRYALNCPSFGYFAD
jgi:hypothetical protein